MKESSLIAKINLNGTLKYVTDRKGIKIEGFDYENIVLSWGNISNYGNILNFENCGIFDVVIILDFHTIPDNL